MARRSSRLILLISLITILCATLIPTRTAQALMVDASDRAGLPVLNTFINQVADGQAGELRGLYIPGILAARVVQQPDGVDGFISPWQNIVTQFGLASKLGSTGLLAHNNLAGERFASLRNDQKFYLIYGDGQVATFVVSDIHQYQALQPYSTLSSFVDLENGTTLTTRELFTRVYDRPGQVVFQTCIDAYGIPSWGRLFVTAEPSAE